MDYIEQREILNPLLQNWLEQFKQTNYFSELDVIEQSQTDFTIQAYADFMLSYHKKMPQDWNKADTINIIGELFPMKLKMDDDFTYAFARVLCQFLDFLGEKQILQNTEELVAGVLDGDEQLFLKTTSPEEIDEMDAALQYAASIGVDLTDEAKVDAFLSDFLQTNPHALSGALANKQPIRHEKIGRNSPCPCGSGKKYKKCCG